MKSLDISIIGGCGHIGLPLGLCLASVGHLVTLLDVNENAVKLINNNKLPFLEENAEGILRKVINKNLIATTRADSIEKSQVVIFVTGTPVDEHLNPRIHDVIKIVQQYIPYLLSDQLIILRSTVYPGMSAIIDNILKERWGKCKVAYCPERIVQGKGIEEIFRLPQIVSATSEEAEMAAAELFSTIAPKIIKLETTEAELAKLITNAWRYLEFAIANQFYMMVESQGLDFYKIYGALQEDYPRALHFARAGLTAGPCLFKDTMQLSAFQKNGFFLGHAAMLVNEGLPMFLVDQMENKLGYLKGKRIAVLGLTFKANNDDIRESLAFKVKKILDMKQARPLLSDVYLSKTLPLSDAIEQADGIILGVPHKEYLFLKPTKPYVDCWGVWDRK